MTSKEVTPVLPPERSLREKCGIVGLYFPSARREVQVTIGLNSLIALWHRGQQGIGVTIKDDDKSTSYHGIGSDVEQALPPDTINYLKKGTTPLWMVGQTRYGTSGGWNKKNLQPMTEYSANREEITIAHNGQFTGIEEMKRKVRESIPEDASDTFIFSKLLAKAEGNSWDEKIISTLEKVNGAYSLIIGTNDSLYLARDPQGIRPLVLGKIGDGFIATSETIALDKAGASTIRQIKRGEILKINKDGIRVIKEGQEGDGNFCDFEKAYFSRPDSFYPYTVKDEQNPEKWQSVYEFREECGKILAEESPIFNASFAIGIADSGVPVTIGYANASGTPYRQLILRDHYDPNGKGRLFQTDFDMEGIQQKTHGKLSLVRNSRIWKDAVVVLGEDSIVRGNTSKVITQAVFELGAKEVHWIIGFPKVMHPCHLGVSMRTYEELIAPKNNGDSKKIAEEIGATSVNYISHKGFIKARLKAGKDLFVPENKNEIFLANGGCGGCLTGLHPVSKEGVVYDRKQLIPASV